LILKLQRGLQSRYRLDMSWWIRGGGQVAIETDTETPYKWIQICSLN
jgi:hypothetical protein